jgi:hypothetical protein
MRLVQRCYFRDASGGVPKPDHLNDSFIVIEPVHNSVPSDDNLPNGFILEFRYDPASLRKMAQTFGVLNQQSAKA